MGLPQDIYEVLWVFLLYAVLGWMVEVAYAGVCEAKFVNRGFLNGPYCPIYGFGMLIVVMILYPIKENWLLLFLGAFLLTTVLEYLTGLILEKIFHHKWWDYSDIPFNIQGYVCLKFSLMWGLGGTFIVAVVHPFFYKWIHLIPTIFDRILLAIMVIGLLVDVSATVSDILKFNKRIKQLDQLAMRMRKISDELGEDIFDKVTLAMQKGEDILSEHDEKVQQFMKMRADFEAKLKDKHRASERLIKAFPNIKSRKWGEVLEKYKDTLKIKAKYKNTTKIEQILGKAKQTLEEMEPLDRNTNGLVYVVITKKSNTYVVKNDDFGEVVERMKESGDTEVSQMLAMWKDGAVDISSYRFRKELLCLNQKNKNTEILVQTYDGIRIKRLMDTMK